MPDTEPHSDDPLYAPAVSSRELELSMPPEVKVIWPHFEWRLPQLWALERPAERMPVLEFLWLLELPLWRWQGQRFRITPAQVLANPTEFWPRYEKAMSADLTYPIHVAAHGGRWVILDGYHRLLKAVVLGENSIAVVRVTECDVGADVGLDT